MKVTLTTVYCKYRQGDKLPWYTEGLREIGFTVTQSNMHANQYEINPYEIEVDINTIEDILRIVHLTGYSVELYYNGTELCMQIRDGQ